MARRGGLWPGDKAISHRTCEQARTKGQRMFHEVKSEQVSKAGSTGARVSVAMTTYNGARFLREQLATLEAQTLRPYEVIISDDGSTDETRAILADAAASSLNIVVRLNEQRLGWRRNFFEAMSHCTGDLIQFCDQDDLWEPTKLEEMAAAFADPGVMMAFHDATLIDINGEPIGTLGNGGRGGIVVHEPLSLDIWKPILGFSIMFRREILAYNRFWARSMDKLKPEEKAPHDEWVFFLALVLGKIAHVKRPLVRYRIHETNTMGWRHTRHTLSDLLIMYRNSEQKLRQRINVMRNRIGVLEAIAAEGGDKTDAVTSGLVALRAHLALNERRLHMYHRRNMLTRGAELTKMLLGRDYTSVSLPLSRAERMRDVAVATFGLKEG